MARPQKASTIPTRGLDIRAPWAHRDDATPAVALGPRPDPKNSIGNGPGDVGYLQVNPVTLQRRRPPSAKERPVANGLEGRKSVGEGPALPASTGASEAQTAGEKPFVTKSAAGAAAT